MLEHFPLMVPGASRGEPAEVRAVRRSPIATVEQVDAAGVERALATADALFRDRDALAQPGPADRNPPPARRPSCSERRDELALEAAREGGKPLVDSLVEADRADRQHPALRRAPAQPGAAREIPMGLQRRLGRPAGLHAARADRRRCWPSARSTIR